MKQAESYLKKREKFVWKIEKSIYGRKQSGHNWNEILHSCLIDANFTQNPADHCVYTNESKWAGKVIIVVWVDYLIIASNNTNSLEQVKMMLSTGFIMKHLRKLKHFLGMDFSQCDDYVSVAN